MIQRFKELLATPATNLGRVGRFLVFQYRLWSHVSRLLDKNRATQLAAALSYYTIFGIIPLAIVVVMMFHSIPAYRTVGEQLKKIVYSELRLTQIEYPDPDNPDAPVALTNYLDRIIREFFASLNKGSLTLISAVLVIWAALRLLSIIESAFDHIWYVPHGRRFLHRIINYWALLTLVPLLLAAGFYATTRLTILRDIEANVAAALGPLISYVLSTLSLFLLYLVMPNAKVQARAALWGAAVAALVWSLARWGFGVYVLELIPYSTIYGVLGLIPLAIFWVYITWVIVLLGVQLTFAIQHFDTLERAQVPTATEAEGRFIANDMTAIAVARELALAFENDRGPISTDEVCSRLDIPGEFGQKLLDALVREGLLAKTSQPAAGFILAKDPGHIQLSRVADAVAAASFGQPKPDERNILQVAQAQRRVLAQYNLRQILELPAPVQESPQAGDNTPSDEAPQSESL